MSFLFSHHSKDEVGAEAEENDVGDYGGGGCNGLIVQAHHDDGAKRL
jgi:hypothetical protein